MEIELGTHKGGLKAQGEGKLELRRRCVDWVEWARRLLGCLDIIHDHGEAGRAVGCLATLPYL